MHCAIIMVVTVFICMHLFPIVFFKLLFSYSATQPQV